jgi:hypothetical protein
LADWTTDQIKARIRGEAERQKVDPDLALAVATQESYLNPGATGDNGKSLGLFQLQPGAAIDVGVNPQFRQEPGVNIYGGVKYLAQKLQQSKGNVEEALRRYNGGGDPNYVQNVFRFFKPVVAEAAERPLASGTYTDTDVQNALQALGGAQAPQAPQAGTYTDADVQNALAALGGAQAPTEAPEPPTARSTPEQDAAYRAALGQQAPAPGSQAPPPPPAHPGASQGPETRFLALPAIQQLPPSERSQRLAEFRGLRPDLQAEFLASEEPPSQLTVDIEKTSPASPTTMRGAIQAIEPLTPRGAEAVQGRVHESGIPLSAVPAIAVNTLGTVGGAALGALTSPVTGLIGPAAGAAIGGSLATRANTALGLAQQEQPLLETPYANVYPSDLLGAIPLGIATGTAALKGTVRNLPGANVARHDLAGERLGELAQRTAPARPASELFTEAATQGGAVPTSNLWRTSAAVVREEQGMQPGFRNTEAIQAGRGLLALMRQHGGRVPLDALESYRQRLGQKIGTTTDQAELRRLRQMYAALHSDLEQASTAGAAAGAGTLREAIAASRREHAHQTLTDLWSPGKGIQQTAGDRQQVYGKHIQNQFEKRMTDDQVFAGSFTPAELTDIRTTLRDVSRLTRITNPEAQGTIGSTLKWLGRLGGAGYGATTGDLLTGGAMILATEGASAVLARAMQSNLGRLALREAIREGNGRMTHGSLSAIAALVAREAAPEPPAPAPTP